LAVNPNILGPKKKTPLLVACEKGHLRILRRLLQHPNIQVNSDFFSIGTLLHRFSYWPNPVIVQELLLHHDIDIMAVNHIGEIPLHCACSSNSGSHRTTEYGIQIVTMLLSHQSQLYRYQQLNMLDHDQQTPFHRACSEENSELVQVLLSNYLSDVNLTATDRNGNSALHLCCHKVDEQNYSHVKTISTLQQLLNQPTIRIHERNHDGNTAWDLIRIGLVENNRKETKDLFREMATLLYDSIVQQRWNIFCFVRTSK
jgi:ankyrin repeat protein